MPFHQTTKKHAPKNRVLFACLIAGVVGVVLSTPVAAATISASVEAVGDPTSDFDGPHTAASGMVTAAASSGGASGSASAEFLTLTGASGASQSGDTAAPAVGGLTTATWEDDLTINSTGSGSVTIAFSLSGLLAASHSGETLVGTAGYNVDIDLGGGLEIRSGSLSSESGFFGDSLDDFNIGPFTGVTFGTPLSLSVSLTTHSDAAQGTLSGIGTGSASASVTDVELVWLGFTVHDLSDDVVNGLTTTSTSGTDYGTSSGIAAVPEPTTFVLAALGLLSLGMTRRRRHR